MSKQCSCRIKQYIDQNYSQPISLKSLSKCFYISPYYLAHIFKAETGVSIFQYIMNNRLGEAQLLLIKTNLPITDISRKVGYENVNYFSRLFKKKTGLAPELFREKSLSGEIIIQL